MEMEKRAFASTLDVLPGFLNLRLISLSIIHPWLSPVHSQHLNGFSRHSHNCKNNCLASGIAGNTLNHRETHGNHNHCRVFKRASFCRASKHLPQQCRALRAIRLTFRGEMWDCKTYPWTFSIWDKFFSDTCTSSGPLTSWVSRGKEWSCGASSSWYRYF